MMRTTKEARLVMQEKRIRFMWSISTIEYKGVLVIFRCGKSENYSYLYLFIVSKYVPNI